MPGLPPHTPESAILTLVTQRGPNKTICPAEAARLLSPENWRAHLPAIQAAVQHLHATGQITVTQRGQPADPATARGPIRLGLRE
ncbi:MAG: DUF3253 domain-containing protein [Planctomycetota bacterium]